MNSRYKSERLKQRGMRFYAVVCFLTLILSWVPYLVRDSVAWNIRGHFYIIGVGPAGPQMATLQALETISKMDYIIASDLHKRLFSKYIGKIPVMDFDPWKGFWDYRGKDFRRLSPDELEKFRSERFKIRNSRVKRIKNLLARGKNVGLLDSGNPCLFGPSHWYIEEFDPADLVVIPGMGCVAAALATIKKSIIPAYGSRFVLETAPFFLLGPDLNDHKVLKDLAKYPMSMVFYMALWQPKRLFEALKENFPPDMPCAVVYWAGYPDLQRVVLGQVGNMEDKLLNEKERFMGLLFVGRFLEGKPYEAAMRRQ